MMCFNGLADDDNDASGNRAEVSLAGPYSFCEHAGRRRARGSGRHVVGTPGASAEAVRQAVVRTSLPALPLARLPSRHASLLALLPRNAGLIARASSYLACVFS